MSAPPPRPRSPPGPRPPRLTARCSVRRFEANFGQQIVTIAFHVLGGSGGAAAGAGAAEGPARLVRRGSRMDVLL